MGRPSGATFTLRAILNEYDDEHDQAELDRFRQMPTLREAIRVAARCSTEDDVPYGHQQKNWNFWPESIRRAARRLVAAEAQFASCQTFGQVHDLVRTLTAELGVPGLGELYCYDVAFRIGAHLGLFPDRVFLHAGTREGAERLLGRRLRRVESVDLSELPDMLWGWEPWKVENILCSYAKRCRATG
jgi:hypothetical protein